jgi:hypothetical protein
MSAKIEKIDLPVIADPAKLRRPVGDALSG